MPPVLFIVYVPDQAAAAAFYRTVLGVAPTLDVPGMTELPLGPGAALGLMPEAGIERLLPITTTPRAPRAELYLRVPDAAATFARALAAGATELSPLQLRGWGEVVAYALAPEGTVLAVAQNANAEAPGKESPRAADGPPTTG